MLRGLGIRSSLIVQAHTSGGQLLAQQHSSYDLLDRVRLHLAILPVFSDFALQYGLRFVFAIYDFIEEKLSRDVSNDDFVTVL